MACPFYFSIKFNKVSSRNAHNYGLRLIHIKRREEEHMDWTWLVLLACPLMMLPMMFMMMKGNHGSKPEEKSDQVVQELNELKRIKDELLEEVKQLKEQR